MQTTRDRFGREVHKGIRSGSREQGRYSYRWGIANRLLSKENELTGTVTTYDYDEFDFLIREQQTSGQSTESIYRMPDRIGNLFESPDKKDRTYAPGGRLEADKEFHYHYDDEGNLIFKEYRTQQPDITNYHRKAEEQELKITFKATGTGWRYDWYANGMLKKVTRPDGQTVHFTYDVLGRRTSKLFKGKLTRWVWDGNTPLHEWSYRVKEQLPNREKDKEPTENLITWVFEAGTFVPAAKLTEGKQYSIITDYLGTPIQMYDDEGKLSWDCTLDIYGKVRSFSGYSSVDCPFRYQGQYQDEETGLYYNRFRYYSPEEGMYISQDPIGLAGGDRLYAYVHDVNSWLDPFGLSKQSCSQKKGINKATHDLKKMVLQ